MAQLGFIGAGNMAEALIAGCLRVGLYQPAEIQVYDVAAARLEYIAANYGVTAAAAPADLIAASPTVLLAVKPDKVASVLKDNAQALKNKLVISIAAGVTLDSMAAELPAGSRVIRVMPNTPALVQAAASCLCANAACKEADLGTAAAIFGAIGLCRSVPEAQLNAVTALSGSGPAFCFMFLEALADGGVRAGLLRELALELAAKTLEGSARLFLEKKLHPGQLKDMVTSPAGTTIAGVAALEEHAFRAAAMAAVAAAHARAVELAAN